MQGMSSQLFCRGGKRSSERSWNRHVATQFGAELDKAPALGKLDQGLCLYSARPAPCSEPRCFPSGQNPPSDMRGGGGEKSLSKCPFKKSLFPIIAILVATRIILKGDPETQCTDCIVAPKKPQRADFPVVPRQLAGSVSIYFLL